MRISFTAASIGWRLAAGAVVLSLLGACGGGGDTPAGPNPNPNPNPTPTFPNPSAGEAAVAVSVGIPAGFFATPSQLSLFAGTQPTQLDANGTGRTNLPTNALGVVGVAAQGTNTPVLLGLNVGGAASQEVSVRSTAEALSALVPALATTNTAQAATIMNVLRASPAVAELTTVLGTRLTTDPQSALVSQDPAVVSALRSTVTNVLQAVPSPRYEEPARALPAVETATDRGGIQISVLPQRDAQGRQQVRIDNGRPRYVAVVRSYSNDGVNWTTPAQENGVFGVMVGPGVQGTSTAVQPSVTTIPLTLSPYTRIKTFAIGSNLAAAEADPDGRYLLGAVALQGLASTALPALGPVLATNQLHSGITWGSGDTGVLQQWVLSLLPCFQDPVIRAAIEQGVTSGNLDEAFRLGFACMMRVGGQNPAILNGLLAATGQGGRTVPGALTRMFEVIGTLGTGVENVFNTDAIRATNALNVFDIVDSTLFMAVDSVVPVFANRDGGQAVELFGSNLGSVTAVTVGGVAATNVQVVSPTRVNMTLPAQSSIGAKDVVATGSTGTSATCAQCVIYFTPTIGVSPLTGPIGGGTTVTVTDIPGTALMQGVQLGTTAATGFTVLSPTSVRFVTPAVADAGAVDVVFDYGTRGLLGCPGCFTYQAVSMDRGRFSGVVRNAVGETPIAGASVSVRGPGNSVVDEVVSGTDGTWQSSAIPAGTYDLHFSATGFQNTPLFGRLLVGGSTDPVTALPTVFLVPTNAGSGSITGTVRDATTNAVIAGATVEVRTGSFNISGAPLATTTSSTTGTYTFASLPAGTYTLRATNAGFTEGSVTATVVGATQTAPVLFLSPVGSNVAWRFVLSWGANPRDLDSHLTGPVPGSSDRFHVYFSRKGSLTASPFARLDVDVTSGFGPETITMAQQFDGVYRYYVYLFSGSGSISTSGARLNVYQGNTLVRQFFPPQGTGRYWTVFEIDGSTLTSINTIGTVTPAMRVGPVLQVDSPASRAAREWLSLAPWHWTKP